MKKLGIVDGLRNSIRKTSGTYQPTSNEEIKEASQKSDATLLEDFERLLENMNLTEEKKIPLRNLSNEKKKEMVAIDVKNRGQRAMKDQSSKSNDSPNNYISILSAKEASTQKLLTCVEALKVALTNNSLEWVHAFGETGLIEILNLMEKSFNNDSNADWEKIKLGCLKCVKAVMNNKVGLQSIMKRKEAIILIGR